MGRGAQVTRPAIFLDRDGVINRPDVARAQNPIRRAHIAELEILPDVPVALRALKAAGYCLVVVTNQPDIARGEITPASRRHSINGWLTSVLPLDAVTDLRSRRRRRLPVQEASCQV